MGVFQINFLKIQFALLGLLFGISGCGNAYPVHVFTGKDLNTKSASNIGLPKGFPFNPPPNQITISPDPLVMLPTPSGVAITAQVFLANATATNITLFASSFAAHSPGLIVSDGSCTTLAGGILFSGSICDYKITYTPPGTGSIVDGLVVPFNDIDGNSFQAANVIQASSF